MREMAMLAVPVAFFAATRSSTGHAGATDELLRVVVDWAHLIFMSAWAGAVFLASGPVLSRGVASNAAERKECSDYLVSLSAIATWSVAGVTATGIYNAWRGLGGSTGALTTTAYGTVLLWKIALVTVALLMGAYNRFSTMPRSLTAMRVSKLPSSKALVGFRRVLRYESLALLAAIVAAAALSTSDPAMTTH
ncbi:MAG: CopD family protein [Caldimonas sp.]